MIRLLSATMLLIFISSTAWAACKSRDIKGLYLAYATGKRTEASACGLRIAANGRVASGSNCLSASTTSRVTGGRLVVLKDCTVAGVIETNRGNIEVPVGSMDKRKSFIAGVFFFGNDEGSFTAVKHKKITGASPSMARYFEE